MMTFWVRIFLIGMFLPILASCGKGGSAAAIFDNYLGQGSAPALTSFSTQIVTQGSSLNLDFNNLQAGGEGNDKGMRYSCIYDSVVDGVVTGNDSCDKIPHADVSFGNADGVFKITPDMTMLGNYEIKVTGKGEGGSGSSLFVLGVRLKFDGIQNLTDITGNSARLGWLPHSQALGYQVMKLNDLTGLYEVAKSISGGSVAETVYSGLQPNHGYTVRIQAIDALGNLDGNVVTQSFTTTELVRFDLSATSTTVPSGTQTTITIRAKNADNSPQTVGGIPITAAIESGSGTATGVFSSVTDNHNGTYTLTFTGGLVGTPITVALATSLNFNIDTPLTLRVVPGTPSAVSSVLSLAQTSIPSATSTEVSATIRDANGNLVLSGPMISFTASGGTSTATVGTVSTVGDGIYKANITGVISGTALTVKVFADGQELSGVSSNLTVVPGTPVTSKSSLSLASATVVSGSSVLVTATLRDANNNFVPSGVFVTFNKSGGTSSGDFNSAVTNLGNGQYTTTYTGNSAGTAQTISVSVNGVPLGMTAGLTVIHGAPVGTQSLLTVSAATVSSGNFVTVTANLRDANSNPITSGVVSFSKTGGTSTGNFGAVIAGGNGIYTVQYTGVIAGSSQSIQVSVGGVVVPGISGTIQVTPGTPAAAKSSLTISLATLPSGQDATVTATLRDANNNVIPSGVSLGFSKAGGTSTGNFGPVNNAGSGVYTTTYTGVIAGSAQTIGVTIDGAPLGLSTSVVVVPGIVDETLSSFTLSQSTVPSATTSTFTATLRDLNNNTINSGITVTMSTSGGTSTGTLTAVTAQGAGIFVATFTGLIAGTAKTAKISVNGAELSSLAKSLVVVPGAPSSAQSLLVVSSSTVVSGQSVSLTATLKDVNSNVIPSGVVVNFNKIGGSSTGDVSAVTNNGDGTYVGLYSGLTAGTAQTISISANGITLTPTVSIAVLAGPPSLAQSSFSISNSTVSSGSFVTVTAVLKDANSNPIPATGIAFAKTGGTSTGTFGSMNASTGTFSIRYTGVSAGTAQTITIQQSGVDIAGLSGAIQVIPGTPSVSKSIFTLTSSTVVSGTSVALNATILDDNSNPISTGISVSFTKAGGTSTGDLSSVVNSGSGHYSASYTGLVAGSAQTLSLAIDGSALGLSKNITVLAGAPSALNSTFTVSSSTVTAGNSITLSSVIRDSNNNPIYTGILVGFDAVGGTSTGFIGSTISDGVGGYTSTFKGVTSGTAKTLNVTVNGAAFGNSLPVQVLTGPPSAVTSTLTVAAANVKSAEDVLVTATLKDSENNPVNSGVTVSFSKSSGTSTGSFSPVTAAGAGVYTTNYTGLVAGTAQTLKVIVDGNPLSLMTFITVIPGNPNATTSTFTLSADSVAVASSVTLTAVIKDTNGNNIVSGVSVGFSKTGGTSAGTLSAVNNLGTGTYTATYTGTGKGTAQTLQTTIGGVSFGATRTLTVTAGPPHHLVFSSAPATIYNMNCSGPYVITIQDASNVATSQSSAMNLAFSSAGNAHDGTLFSDASCTNNITDGIDIPAFGETAFFYFKSVAPVSFTLGVTSSTAGVAGVSRALYTYPVLAWIGAGGIFTTNGNGPLIVGGDQDGGMVEPFDIIKAGSNTYVLDYALSRVIRFDSNFNMTGWIGVVGSTENISCPSTPTIGSFTPGWCTGGRPQIVTSGILYQTKTMTADTNYLYLTQGSSIVRFNLSAGTYAGWIGMNPSSGSVCGANSTVNSSWCLLPGVASNAPGVATTALGGFNGSNATLGIRYANVGGVDYLFVGDNNNGRVVRVRTDGSNPAWIGMVGSVSPTSPSACNGLPAGATTPEWCTSGTSATSTKSLSGGPPATIPNEGFNNPIGIDFDENYLYIADSGNVRIARWSFNGSFAGWVGGVTSASAGMASPAPVSNYTNGWTVGGAVNAASGSTGFGNIYKIRNDANYLYAVDSYHRLVRVNKSDGKLMRWIGRVGTPPSGGQPGCSSLAVGSSPLVGWCSGGAANKYGIGNAAFNEARSLEIVNGKLIVADRYNSRLQQFEMDEGKFEKWIGYQRISSSGWRKDNVWAARGGYEDSSFGINLPNVAMGITVDTSGNLFVVDQAWNRIKKYSTGLGIFAGYIGTFNGNNAYSPISPDDCVGVTSGMTPTWCFGGGRTNSGTGVHGYSNPSGITSDGVSIYVANMGNNRIDKVNIADGSYIGWVGKIGSQPNDGLNGCANASSGYTPDWCVGGTATTGTDYGSLDGVRAVTWDRQTEFLFAADNRGRLYKISAQNGSLLGVTGSLTSAGGCSVTASAAQGWCGLNSVAAGVSSGYGRLTGSMAVSTDNTYIYVIDSAHRVNRFLKSTGAPAGFIGALSSATGLSLTGYCNDTSWNSKPYTKVTPGWCVATALGTAAAHTGSSLDGGLQDPRGVYSDGTNLYVLDSGNYRINRYDALSGAFYGWKGRVATSPTGGEAGCTELVPGDVTSSWCKGGAAAQSSKLGGFDLPTAMSGDSFYLYVFDSRNNRVQAIPK
jgi:hypothetical protein